MSSLLKNLLIALGITLVLGGGYYLTIGSPKEGDLASDPTGAFGTSNASVDTAKILADTQKINRYVVDVSIFEDPRFISLKDHSAALPVVGTGRQNPFAPLR